MSLDNDIDKTNIQKKEEKVGICELKIYELVGKRDNGVKNNAIMYFKCKACKGKNIKCKGYDPYY